MNGSATRGTETTLAIAGHKRRLDGAIRALLADPSHPVGFVCECGGLQCFAVDWLPADEYDSRRVGPSWAALARHRALKIEEAA
jgi:hypothetical protein